MKLSRRNMLGTMVGAAAATQMETQAYTKTSGVDILNQKLYEDKISTAPQADPEYWTKQVKHCKKILSGDFSDCAYEFEDNTRGRTYGNIESLKSISPVARQTFIENALNNRKKYEIMERARKQLDDILGLPFSVTGILFDE